MKPLQAADMSNAGTPGSPRSAPMKHAVDGKTISGVIVAQTIRSRSFGSMPAASMALRAAAAPRVAVDSPGPAMRRSRMPVRWTIHSSLVSTIRDSSSLVRRFSGSALPVPVMMAPKVVMCSIADFELRIADWEGRGPEFSLQIRNPQFPVSVFAARDAGGDALDDLLVHAAGHELFPDADGVHDRPRVALAVADQAVPSDAQQRRSAVLLPVVFRV